MIGGSDHTLNVAGTPQLREMVQRYFNTRWPAHVAEVDALWNGVFFYRDAAAKAAWDAVGAEQENQDTMIHALYGETCITFVTSHVDGSETQRIARELIKNIENNFHVFPRT